MLKTRQGRTTLIGAAVLAVLLAAVWLITGGNRAPDQITAGDPTDESVIATSAAGTVPAAGDTTVAPSTTAAEQAEEPADIDRPPTTEAATGFSFPTDMEFPDPTEDSSASTTIPSTTTTTSTTTTVVAPEVDDTFARSVLVKEGWAAFGSDQSKTTLVQIGDDAGAALDAAIATLGEPTDDTGFIEDDECSAIRTRRVRFGGLELVLAEQVEEIVTFEQWFIDGDLPAGVPLEIEDGLAPGMSVQDLLAIDVLMVIFEDDDGSGSFKMPGDTSNSPVWGRTTGTDSTDTVTSIWSGTACRRL